MCGCRSAFTVSVPYYSGKLFVLGKIGLHEIIAVARTYDARLNLLAVLPPQFKVGCTTVTAEWIHNV